MRQPLAAHVWLAPLVLFGLLAAAPQIRSVEGQVIEARVMGSTTLYLWDATPYVVDLVHDHLVGTAGLVAFEEAAVRVLSERAKTAASKNIVLRVLYKKTGAVNPAYGTPTFTGVEKVFTMRASRKNVTKYAGRWIESLTRGVIPQGLLIEITGKLPPPG